MPDTDSPPDSYTERNQTGHNKDPKSHSAYLHTRVQVPPPDYSPSAVCNNLLCLYYAYR